MKIDKKPSGAGPPPAALPLDPAGGSAPIPPFRLAFLAFAVVRLLANPGSVPVGVSGRSPLKLKAPCPFFCKRGPKVN